MWRNDLFAVCVVTLYLVVFCILLQITATQGLALLMFALSPLFICWMVYTVLKYGKYNGLELGKREFGYQDKEPYNG